MLLRGYAADSPLGKLLGSGVSLILAPPAEPRSTPRAWERSSRWPVLAHLLSGAPALADGAQRVLSAQGAVGAGVSAFAFEDLFQLVASGRMDGRLIVYNAHQLGTLEFKAGEIVGASLEGDPWTLDALLAARGLDPADRSARLAASRLLIQHRAVSMVGAWRESRMAFVTGATLPPTGAEPGVEISADKLVFDLAMWLDEAPRNARRIGGLDRIWRPEDGAEAPTSGEAARLWPHLDGVRTLRDAARLAGVVDHDAASATASLLADGRITATGEGAEVARAVSLAQVVQVLGAAGLASEAASLIEHTAEARPALMGGDEWFLLAHLKAKHNAGEAAAAFRRAADALGRGLSQSPHAREHLVDSLLNVLLIETRTRVLPPETAWATFRERIEPGAARHLDTPRRQAIAAELALRAGAEAPGRAWVERLRASSAPEAPGLLRALDAVLGRGRA
jgi:hypothetical protein